MIRVLPHTQQFYFEYNTVGRDDPGAPQIKTNAGLNLRNAEVVVPYKNYTNIQIYKVSCDKT